MYRAMTLKVLREGIDIQDRAAISRAANNTTVRLLAQESGTQKVLLDGEDVTEAIRRPEVTATVSAVSSIKEVREVMVREQRRMAEQGGIVLEGRDIGTVVFPEADLKIFMVADVRERAFRRKKELESQGHSVPIDQLVAEIMERDEKDSVRDVSPLRKADDAVVLDTSTMTIEQQVDFIVQRAHELIR